MVNIVSLRGNLSQVNFIDMENMFELLEQPKDIEDAPDATTLAVSYLLCKSGLQIIHNHFRRNFSKPCGFREIRRDSITHILYIVRYIFPGIGRQNSL